MRMERDIYGDKSDQIHEFFRKKREWSRVKDEILGKYITCYLRTIPRRGRPIIIIDAFAGPGKFGDDSDGSPVIICNKIDKMRKRIVGIGCIFADSHLPHRIALQDNIQIYIESGIAEKPLPSFSNALSRALEVGKGSTLFFYLDPYGIKELEFETVAQIYERNVKQSTEVLINFSYRAFMRLAGNWNYSDSAGEVQRKVKEAKIARVDRVMNGNWWMDIVTDASLKRVEREEIVVAGYVAQLEKYFKYVYAIPVKEQEEGTDIPVEDLARYHLIFGTRSPRAVVYMNDVALNALSPYLNQFKEGLLFDFTPSLFEKCSERQAKDAILQALSKGPISRPQIYEGVIPKYFMQRLKKDYRQIIDEMAFKEKMIFPDIRTMKSKRRLNDHTLLSIDPWGEEEVDE